MLFSRGLRFTLLVMCQNSGILYTDIHACCKRFMNVHAVDGTIAFVVDDVGRGMYRFLPLRATALQWCYRRISCALRGRAVHLDEERVRIIMWLMITELTIIVHWNWFFIDTWQNSGKLCFTSESVHLLWWNDQSCC